MNQSKKVLAAMLAIPATVIVAGQVQAAEVTSTFEIKNDFVGTSDVKSSTSIKTITATTKEELEEKVLLEMSSFTKGFTVTYTGPEMEKYKEHTEAIFESLKANLNGTTKIETKDYDNTMLYGTFNNVHVKATETKTDAGVTKVELAFSFNYFADSTSSGVLDEIARKLTGNTDESILKDLTTNAQKVKVIHDYVINKSYNLPDNHNVAKMTLDGGGSPHAYALWTYKLLKAANIEVRYVSGISDGEQHSWNLVEIDGQWYHLDLADNDNQIPKSKDIKYRYFLAANETIGGREIYYGVQIPNGSLTNLSWGKAFMVFEDIVNPTQANNVMYYANGVSNGEIFELNLEGLSQTPTLPLTSNPIIPEATSGYGKILHYEYKPTTGDVASIDYLYFINDAVGKYLYQYKIGTTGENGLQLIVNEPIKFISIDGSDLMYTSMNGSNKTIKLNKIEDVNKTEAKKVKDMINNLNISTPPTEGEKAKVIEIRKLYMALTPEQKLLVGNESIEKLKNIERQLANSDDDVWNVISLINDLDPLNPDFIIKVNDAKKAFNKLTQGNKLLVYNQSILDEKFKQVEEAENLSKEIIRVLDVGSEPFKTNRDFIKNLEAVMTKYEDLLPSLKKAIDTTSRGYLEGYIAVAKDLRQELDIFINKVNIINDNSEDYLTSMNSIEESYKALLVSQESLLTDSQRNKIKSNIAQAQTMNNQITEFEKYMATVTSGDVGTIVLTPEIISNMKAAEALHKKMKPSQIKKAEENDAQVFDKLKVIIGRIENLVNDADVIAVKTAIEGLNYNNYTNFKELKSAVTSADTAYTDLEENKKGLIPPELKGKLDGYNKAVKDIESIQEKINSLDKLSTRKDILEVRAEWDKLNSNPIYKKFVNDSNLITQENRIQETDQAERVQKVIEAINGLSDNPTYADVKLVYDQYIALGDAKLQVTNAQRLETLWAKVGTEKAAIDHVNNLIKDLSSKSTRDDIQAAQDAYDALPESSQALVVDYDKIARLLEELDGKEEELADKEAARLVEEKINALNDESSPTDIAGVRAAYEALNGNAKKLVSKKMLDLLEFYEKSMKEQADQAQKEAQVVIDRINRITNSYTEAQIKDVRLAYNALSDLAKTYVTNLQKLIDAEAYILYQNTVVKEAKLQAAAFDAYMANISRTSSTAEIARARAYYNSLSYEAKRYVKTYEKLRRLETMWNDPDYLGLIFTYYPDYINAIKPGGIEVEKPVYDPLYIPDDSDSFAYYEPDTTWSPYEEMAYYNGRYTTKIEASQVKNVVDKTMMLTAEDIEILIPTADIQGASAAVGVSLTADNDKLVLNFTQGQAEKVFSDFVEIRIPMRTLGGNSSMFVQRTDYNGSTSASYKVDGSNFIIRTKVGGTFTARTSKATYSDLASSNTSAMGIRELAKRDITYSTSGKSVIPNKNVTRADVATLLAKALDVSGKKATKYTDLKSTVSSKYVQGLLEAGVMSGVTAQQFRPHSAVSRQEAAIIIANMYRYLNQDLSLAYNDLKTNFRDVSHLSYEARQSIAILELFGVVDGTASSKYNPDQKLTRAEFAEMLYKALNAIDYL